MNAIVGFSGLLNDPELTDEERKNFVSVITSNSEALLRITSYNVCYTKLLRFFDASKEYSKQLIWIGLSVMLIWAIFLTDSKFYVAFSYFLYGFSIFLLFSVIFFGKEIVITSYSIHYTKLYEI